eukprot:gb/GECG01001877.1/.p1 GENE.gb/GECG01001877.1/~~gb/GECG01001877.1/.p1  ORF type:complete len:317 (+),score=54.36 gb/GECG01001877.1/:1-951(+)
MSLGFLTESTILPRKAKSIRVSGSSILPLQSLKAEKEQSLADHLEQDEETGEVYSRRSGTVGSFRQTHRQRKGSTSSSERHKRGSKRHTSDETSTNRGVSERDERDRSSLRDADESSKEQKVYAKLLEKSKLYDKLVSGDQADTQDNEEEDSAPLVDFERKRFEMLKQKYGDDPSKIVKKLQEERDSKPDAEQLLGRDGQREFERIEEEVGGEKDTTAASACSDRGNNQAANATSERDVHQRAREHIANTAGKRARAEHDDNTVEIEDEFGRIRRVPKGLVPYVTILFAQRQYALLHIPRLTQIPNLLRVEAKSSN